MRWINILYVYNVYYMWIICYNNINLVSGLVYKKKFCWSILNDIYVIVVVFVFFYRIGVFR